MSLGISLDGLGVKNTVGAAKFQATTLMSIADMHASYCLRFYAFPYKLKLKAGRENWPYMDSGGGISPSMGKLSRLQRLRVNHYRFIDSGSAEDDGLWLESLPAFWLPTRVNLSRRGVLLDSHLCPLCNAAMEDVQHVFFRCDVARVVLRKICRWWDLDWQEICSFSDWDAWCLSRHKAEMDWRKLSMMPSQAPDIKNSVLFATFYLPEGLRPRKGIPLQYMNLRDSGSIESAKVKLAQIDINIDNGNVSDDILLERMELSRIINDFKHLEATDRIQKAKLKWAIEGDENSKFFHGIINKKRSQLSIRGVINDGQWHTDPEMVKDAFMRHFANRFKQPGSARLKINVDFPNRLSIDQTEYLDRCISIDEIRCAVWDCGANKSPGPDGYTFDFFRRYWSFIGPDFCSAVEWFFDKGSFPIGSNASFIALIPKVADAKFVADFRPISLIGSVYKVVTKILANRLATVISDLVSDTQTAFVANRQILDGPFILNELLSWCKRKKKQAMIFKVDFEKAYDSVRWDYLMDVLHAFGFGPNWCKWISGTLSSSMASVLVNGSPSSEFPLFRGLKQGDPLAPFLFILIMESLHISFSGAINNGIFKGIQISESTVLSHLFYADDAIFMGEWSEPNMGNIIKILRCFFLASGLKINIHKSQIMGVGVHRNLVSQAATIIGCSVMHAPFRYLGVMVGDCMTRLSAWSDSLQKLHQRLSKWKAKTLSIGGRLTLLKSVLGAFQLEIKINIFAWQARLDRLPTRSNLACRGIVMDFVLCPICGSDTETISHILFRCNLGVHIFRKICRWWEVDWLDVSSFDDWLEWFSAIRLSSKVKLLMEGVCMVAWWHIWAYRNKLLFDDSPPRQVTLFDDIVSRSYFCTLLVE
ncbi:RNA-directed DNA polymerase, eukaryota [Tanacetum coccineum]|uniref:RNA-directed DNA polymerase, eukaryota n=1 Tax=Tanacetum coccineum TaxID=301880 RepID=A0ABQ5IDP6_9ASTR